MKFKYEDKVKVVSGFYKGVSGIIISKADFPIIDWLFSRYLIKFDNGSLDYIKEKNLKHLKGDLTK